MSGLSEPLKVAVATGNRGKVEEIRATLSFPGWAFVPAAELGVWDPPDETGATFAENALIKARAAYERFDMAALADDSGLEVDALGGAPGVFSSRYASCDAGDDENNARLLAELEGVPAGERTARFRSVVVFLDPEGREHLAEGACEGRIGFAPRGTGGFGYDPLFLPDAAPGRTMAELETAEKNAISHRGSALRALRAALGPAAG